MCSWVAVAVKDGIPMALSKAQLIAKQRALALEIEAAGYKESEVRQGATEATKKDTEAKEAKAYPAAVANIRLDRKSVV